MSSADQATADQVAVDADELVRWVHAVRTGGRRRRDLSDQLYRLYVAIVIVGLPVGYVVVQALGAEVPGPGAVAGLRTGLEWALPTASTLAVLAGLRLGTWRGPVVFDAAETAWLLTAPVPRAALVRPRLVRGLAWGAGLGALGGGLLWIGLVASSPAPPGPLLAACAGSGGLLGVTTAAGSWLVVCRPGLARGVLRATGPVLVLLCAVAAGGDGPAAAVARWSGPWGWVAVPVLAAVGGDGTGWPLAAALLLVTAVAAVVVALQHAGRVSREDLHRRAGTARAVATGVFWLDTGALTEARRAAVSALVGRRLLRVPRPRRRWLAVPWTGALVLARGPWLWARALTLLGAAGGAAAAAVAAGVDGLAWLAWAVVAVVLVHGAAGALVEPVAAEHAQRFGIRHLRWSARTVLLVHLVVPSAVLVVLGAAIAAGAALLAGGSGAAAGLAAGGVALVGPGLVAAAAFARLREPADVIQILLWGEVGVAIFAAQALLGVLAALAVALPPAIVLGIGIAEGAPVPAAAGRAAVVAALTAVAGIAFLRRWLADRA